MNILHYLSLGYAITLRWVKVRPLGPKSILGKKGLQRFSTVATSPLCPTRWRPRSLAVQGTPIGPNEYSGAAVPLHSRWLVQTGWETVKGQ